MNGRTYYVCPGCGRRRVTLRLGAEDGYECDHCSWWAYCAVDLDVDRRLRNQLRRVNDGAEGQLGEYEP